MDNARIDESGHDPASDAASRIADAPAYRRHERRLRGAGDARSVADEPSLVLVCVLHGLSVFGCQTSSSRTIATSSCNAPLGIRTPAINSSTASFSDDAVARCAMSLCVA